MSLFVYILTCGGLTTLCATDRKLCHFSCTFQRAVVLTALCGTDSGLCHLSCTFQHAVVLTALCGTDGGSRAILAAQLFAYSSVYFTLLFLHILQLLHFLIFVY